MKHFIIETNNLPKKKWDQAEHHCTPQHVAHRPAAGGVALLCSPLGLRLLSVPGNLPAHFLSLGIAAFIRQFLEQEQKPPALCGSIKDGFISIQGILY